MDYDGSTISEETYEEGAPVIVPDDPTRESDETYTYEFAGWDADVTEATADVTYTATYSESFIEYSVIFVDDNGETIEEKTDYHYGDEIVVPSDPTKAATDYFTFAFAGWDSEVTATVTGNATYTATYDSILKTDSGFKANNVTAGASESVVLGAGTIGDEAGSQCGDTEKGYVHQAYFAFDGEYSFNDYIAFDFTGKNMPEVAFFAQNYNDSMYSAENEIGMVLASGITDYLGQIASVMGNGTIVSVDTPFMIQNTEYSWFLEKRAENAKLARANLEDGKHYRVILGATAGSNHGLNGVTISWMLYDLDTKAVVEENNVWTYNFFDGSNEKVNNMKLSDLVGSIVLYGKFGTTCTLDKVYGVFEDSTLAAVAEGLNSDKTYTATFKDDKGETLKTIEGIEFGDTVSYTDELPTPEKAEDSLFTYSYVWDKEFVRITEDTVYTLKIVATPKSNVKAHMVTVENGIVLGAGGIGDSANYTIGQNNGGYVNQAYLGLDGDYKLNDYIVFDFTGKNMPEIAFFAKNYNNSMYSEGTSKQGLVVTTGITQWDGTLTSQNGSVGVNGNGTQINVSKLHMIGDAGDGGFMQGSFPTSALGRANLVDGTRYRVIMGFSEAPTDIERHADKITLHWCLYNLDTNTVVEESNLNSWHFFTGSNAEYDNLTRDQLSGSIVFYGKFGTICTIDTIHGVESGAYADVVAKYTAASSENE